MGVLCAHHIQAVDGMSVCGGGEGGALYRRPLPTAQVPQYQLPRVGPSNYVAGVELAEGH